MKKHFAYKLTMTVLFMGCTFPLSYSSNPVQSTKASSDFEQATPHASIPLHVANRPNYIHSESPTAESSDINNAIKRGSVREIAPHLNSTVEIILPGNEGTFSKAQAQMILSSFFDKNPAKSFVIKQEGSSTNTNNFTIGTYTSTSNKEFRVYYVTKKTGNKELIQHIEFELK